MLLSLPIYIDITLKSSISFRAMAEYLEKIVRNDGYQCGPEYHIQNSSNSSAYGLETAESIEKSSTTNSQFPPPTMVPNEDYTSEFIVASFDLDMTQSVCGYPHCSPGIPLHIRIKSLQI